MGAAQATKDILFLLLDYITFIELFVLFYGVVSKNKNWGVGYVVKWDCIKDEITFLMVKLK